MHYRKEKAIFATY